MSASGLNGIVGVTVTHSGSIVPDSFDIRIRIGRRATSYGTFPIRVRTPDGRQAGAQSSLEPPAWTPSLDHVAMLGQIAARVFQGALFDFTLAALQSNPVGIGTRIQLEVAAPELKWLSWEYLAEQPPFAGRLTRADVVRVSPYFSKFALVPMDLPVNVLIAELTGAGDVYPLSFPFQMGDALRYFRTLVAGRLRGTELPEIFRGRTLHVVHLQGRAEWGADGEGVLSAAPDEPKLDAKIIGPLLAKARTRLVILETYDQEHGPLLDLAHRLSKNGPSIIVLSSYQLPAPASTFLSSLYYAITHDEPLDSARSRASAEPNAYSALMPYSALLVPVGGQDLLRISQVASILKARAAGQLNEANRTALHLAALSSRLPPQSGMQDAVNARKNSLEVAIAHLADAQSMVLNYEHETGAFVPLAEAAQRLDTAQAALTQANRYVDRVVNTWFEGDKGVVRPDQSLVAGTRYLFHVQIGTPSTKSNVTDARAIPEDELTRLYSREGVPLRVVLFSNDFVVADPDQVLMLPPPPDESGDLTFAATAPTRSGEAELRACIYYKLNLLQSLRVSATVTAEPATGLPFGNRTRVEFALTGQLRDVERFSERGLNVVANESSDGTHRFGIVGTDLKADYRLTEGEMRSSVDGARGYLQAICSTFDHKGKPDEYRFQPDNRGSEAVLIDDIKKLAEFGFDLYVGLITRKDWAFDDKLRKLLKNQATIQISMVDSANYVFPWALVYDKKLTVGATNVVCSQFLKDVRDGGPPGFLGSQQCLTSGCPSADDTNVVCPSGFWGFRHIIEQPLSVALDQRDDPSDNLAMTVAGAVTLGMAVSKKLSDVSAHTNEVQALAGVSSTVQKSLYEVGKAITRTDLNIVYFYCHGGRSGRKVWLGVGDGESLSPKDLYAWGVRWPFVHPLVFINGCNTVDLTPDDLLQFNRQFAYSRASGVIGTEITIPEELARHFAKGFFEDFISEMEVGASIRRQRLVLLERYNPLGLVYTPYCYGGLHMSRPS